MNKPDSLIGQSNNFLEVLEQVSQVAALHKPVLVIGERGTGKELIAARLHYLSTRWDQTYLKLNCAALNENLLETELFGYDSGAFTGATKRHEGRFERASNGTLFLDEIANTSSIIQEKLLRVVEYGEYERVGGSKTLKTQARIIAATNEDLPTLTHTGRFRADLLDRLAFDVITIPPLRERKEDILLLAEQFAMNMTRELNLSLFSGFTESAEDRLLSYHWPGNVRELKNVVERSVYRNNNAHVPVHQLIIDPFDSPFRPKHNKQITENTLQNIQDNTQQSKDSNNATFINANSGMNSVADTLNNSDNSDISSNSSNTVNNMNNSGNVMPMTYPVAIKSLSKNYEIQLIQHALMSNQYNQKKTAQALSLTYHQLRAYLKKYNLLNGNEEDA